MPLRGRLAFFLSGAAPCALGVAAMVFYGLPVGIWMQGVVSIAVLGLASALVPRSGVALDGRAMLLAAVLLLALTFLHEGTDGVRRWVQVGGFALNASMAVLPAAILCIRGLVGEGRLVLACAGMVLIALMLLFQPDASQLTGFSLALAPALLVKSGGNGPVGKALALFLLAASILSWAFLDDLRPVEYVEGILGMVGGMSPILFACGVVSLVLIPVPFAISPGGDGRGAFACMAPYYWALTLSTFLGCFPVPMMGCGISPVIGYVLAMLVFSGGPGTGALPPGHAPRLRP